MDAVYLTGYGRQRGEPLRYSMRSLVNLPQVTRVVTVGHRWLWRSGEVLHISVQPHRIKHQHTYASLRTALADDRISDRFLLMNDDFFVLQSMAWMPVLHRGPLVDRGSINGNQTLLRRRQQLHDMLTQLGVADPLCYELHVPLPVDRAAMAAALDAAEQVRPEGMQPVGKRTLYGNLAGICGAPADDVKVRGRDDLLPTGPFASTSAMSWNGKAGRQLRELFRAASPWER